MNALTITAPEAAELSLLLHFRQEALAKILPPTREIIVEMRLIADLATKVNTYILAQAALRVEQNEVSR